MKLSKVCFGDQPGMEQLPRVRRQGPVSFSAIEWLGDLGHPTLPLWTSASLSTRRWAGTEGSGFQPALTTDRIGSLREHIGVQAPVTYAPNSPSCFCTIDGFAACEPSLLV